MFVNGNFDWAVTRDQTLQVQLQPQFIREQEPGHRRIRRARARVPDLKNHTNTFRAQEVGPLGRRFFINTRLNVGWSDSERRVASSRSQRCAFSTRRRSAAPRRPAGAIRATSISRAISTTSAASTRCGWERPSTSTGTARTNRTTIWAPTRSRSIEAFEAGRPRSYTRRVGDPKVDYSNLQGALYRAGRHSDSAKSLSVTPGVRFETQSAHATGSTAGPRFGATWAPFTNGKTTLRASWGHVLRLAADEHLRADDSHRRLPAARDQHRESDLSGYATGSARMARRPQIATCSIPVLSTRRTPASAGGVDYVFSPRVPGERDVSLRARRGAVPRPQPERAGQRRFVRIAKFGNVVQVVGDAQMRQHVWNFGGQTNFPAGAGEDGADAGTSGGSISSATTILAWSKNNTDGRVQRACDGRSRSGVGDCGPARQASLQRGVPHPGVQRSRQCR